MPKEARWPSPWPVGRQVRYEQIDVDRWRRDGRPAGRRLMARRLGRVPLLLAVAALLASQWLGVIVD